MKNSFPKTYAGIGSRQTPQDMLAVMRAVAATLAHGGWTLRSGGAEGADSAFEEGHFSVTNERAEIYIPWPGFNGKSGINISKETEAKAFEFVKRVHPAIHRLTRGGVALHCRNVCQILGADLETPAKFVICWTDGGKIAGGTATAIRLAMMHEVPVFNLAFPEHYARVSKLL